MSDTPRTKAASRMAFSGEYMVPIEDAQNIEREIAQYKEANAGLMSACENLERELADMTKQRDHYKAACNQYSEDEMLCKLQEVTKQRDALAEALQEIKDMCIDKTIEFNSDDNCKGMVDDLLEIAEKALAATKGGQHE
jgi:predicted RNase H-like nuclease (RuvC/YqgF family)